VVVVKPGDSLWKLAEENLGKGLRWRDILGRHPAIVDANRIEAGSQIFLPRLPPPSAQQQKSLSTRRHADVIAQAQFGRALLLVCIAHANPSVQDANLIYEGQLLLLPAQCGRS